MIFCEILYVSGGAGSAIVDGKNYELHPGDLVILNPGISHEERSDEENPLVLIFLGIRDFTLPGFPPCHLLEKNREPVIPCGEYRYRMDVYFEELLLESSNQVRYYQQITRSLVSAILVLIMRIMCINTPGETVLSEECSRIKQYLDQNYTSPITLDSLSETVYISKHYLSHMFKEQTGTSPIKYLTSRRISKACELLTTTTMPISEVSKSVGYENPLYFSQVFKKLQGVSPAEYRANKTTSH